jgi:hypothetical protein
MDPVIALLLCGSPFAGSPTGCYDHRAMTVHHAIAVETDPQRTLPYPYVVRVADTSDSASANGRWQGFIAEAAQRFGIPQAWIRAVMRAETGGQATVDGRPITSPAGAIGLMQVMPETYAEMRRRHGLGPDPGDPHDNILAGTAYLREMLDRFGYPHLFVAYNAGPYRFEAYRRGERALPAETQSYLLEVQLDLARASDRNVPSPTSSSQSAAGGGGRASDPLLFFPLGHRSTLFVERHDSASPADSTRPDSPLGPARNGGLFAPLRGTPVSPSGEQGPP